MENPCQLEVRNEKLNEEIYSFEFPSKYDRYRVYPFPWEEVVKEQNVQELLDPELLPFFDDPNSLLVKNIDPETDPKVLYEIFSHVAQLSHFAFMKPRFLLKVVDPETKCFNYRKAMVFIRYSISPTWARTAFDVFQGLKINKSPIVIMPAKSEKPIYNKMSVTLFGLELDACPEKLVDQIEKNGFHVLSLTSVSWKSEDEGSRLVFRVALPSVEEAVRLARMKSMVLCSRLVIIRLSESTSSFISKRLAPMLYNVEEIRKITEKIEDFRNEEQRTECFYLNKRQNGKTEVEPSFNHRLNHKKTNEEDYWEVKRGENGMSFEQNKERRSNDDWRSKRREGEDFGSRRANARREPVDIKKEENRDFDKREEKWEELNEWDSENNKINFRNGENRNNKDWKSERHENGWGNGGGNDGWGDQGNNQNGEMHKNIERESEKSEWGIRNWEGRNWEGRNWEGRNWEGRNWEGRNWEGRNWEGRNWEGRGWNQRDSNPRTNGRRDSFNRNRECISRDKRDLNDWDKGGNSDIGDWQRRERNEEDFWRNGIIERRIPNKQKENDTEDWVNS